MKWLSVPSIMQCYILINTEKNWWADKLYEANYKNPIVLAHFEATNG